MRFFIRNKQKYNPGEAFENPIIAVDVDNTQEICKIKEEVRRIAKGSKITALYVARQDGSFIDLADDRTINYYNLQDGMILETTSNPFWVTTLYSNLKRREQEAAANPGDARLCAQAQTSIIHRYMAIGLLLNGTGKTEKQPPTFHELDDLYEYCMTKGKKPAQMSQFTMNELQEMLDSYNEDYRNKTDPVGSFIHSQAVKLAFLQDDTIDCDDPFRSHFQQYGQHLRGEAPQAARQNRAVQNRNNRGPANAGAVQNRNNRGPANAGCRRANNNRMCNDCEVAMATGYCSECNPSLCLCDNCWMTLHRGATRRNHQRRDLSEAPRQTSYVPQAYRAPFAMLVAFHRASQETPQKLSLTADEIKQRGQPFTDTDLEEAKQRGKPFSGFDSLENALIKNDIVLKEAAGTPKYSLQQSGQLLAQKCSNFDSAIQELLHEASVPTLPPLSQNLTVNNRQVCLLVDTEEPQKDRFVKYLQERGLNVKVRKLPSGDFCWILLPTGMQAHNGVDMPDQELVLPYLVERKTWDDLWTSIRTPRFESQVQRMKCTGIKNLFYLVEGSPKDISGRPGPEVEAFLKGKLDRLLLEDNFFVNRTPSWLKTVEWLCYLTCLATDFTAPGGVRNLMTFTEFTRNTNQLIVNNHGNHTAIRPTQGIVWAADEFAENIRNHHKHVRDIGSRLDQVPHLSDTILVVQGLTAYNTNCHNLYKQTLSDYLRMPGQTAEDCVRIHLEDNTDQLVSVNVFQYYNQYLEVFKGVRIYRTETFEETEEFLTRFRVPPQNDPLVAMMVNGHDHNNDQHDPQERKSQPRMEDDLMFANDSQEEEYMLQQALQQSLAEDDHQQTKHTNSKVTSTITHKETKPSTSNFGTLPSLSNSTNDATSTEDTTRNVVQVKQEILSTPCTLSLDTFPRTNSCTNTDSATDRSSLTIDVKKEITEEEELQNFLQFKFYDEIQGSLQEEQNTQQDIPNNKENVLKKVLEESRLQFEKENNKSSSKVVDDQEREQDLPSDLHGKKRRNSDDDLQKALQASKQQYEREQRGAPVENTQKNGQAMCSRSFRKNAYENDLQKALQQSQQIKQCKKEQTNTHIVEDGDLQNTVLNNDLIDATNNDPLALSEDEVLQRVLKESRQQHEQEQNNLQKHTNPDKDLEKVIEESRRLYERNQRISKLDNKAHATDIKMEKHEDSHPNTPNSQGYDTTEKHKPMKDFNDNDSLHEEDQDSFEKSAQSHDDELEKVLEQSRLEYEMQKTTEKIAGEEYNEDEALKQALQLSIKEMENKNAKEQMKSGINEIEILKTREQEECVTQVNNEKVQEACGSEEMACDINKDQNKCRTEEMVIEDVIICQGKSRILSGTQADMVCKNFQPTDCTIQSVEHSENNNKILEEKDESGSGLLKDSLNQTTNHKDATTTAGNDILENAKPEISRSDENTSKTNFSLNTNSVSAESDDTSAVRGLADYDQDSEELFNDIKIPNFATDNSSKAIDDQCNNNDGAVLVDSQDDIDDACGDSKTGSLDKSSRNLSKYKNNPSKPSVNDRCHHGDGILMDSQVVDDSNGAQDSLDKGVAKYTSSPSNSSVIDRCQNDDSILIDSQNDDDDLNNVSNEPLFSKNHSSSLMNYNSCQNNDAILIDSQEDDCDEDEPNYTSTPNGDVFDSSIPKDHSDQHKKQRNTTDQNKTHRDPKANSTSNPGLLFRQKAEAIAKGKMSLISLGKSKDNGDNTPTKRPNNRGDGAGQSLNEDNKSARKQPIKRAFDGTVKNNINNFPRTNMNTFNFYSSNVTRSNNDDCTGYCYPTKRTRKSSDSTSTTTYSSRSFQNSPVENNSIHTISYSTSKNNDETVENKRARNNIVSTGFEDLFSPNSLSPSSRISTNTTRSSTSTTNENHSAINTPREDYSSTLVFPSSPSTTSTFDNHSAFNSPRKENTSALVFPSSPSTTSTFDNHSAFNSPRKENCTALVFPSSSPGPSLSTYASTRSDDAILIDSQDDYDEVDTATDLEIAQQLQEEWNNEGRKVNKNTSGASASYTGKTYDSDRSQPEPAASNGSLVFPSSSSALSGINSTDSRNTNTPGGFTFPGSSSYPGSSRLNDVALHGFTFPSSSSSASPGTSSESKGQSSSQSKGFNVPKCSDCGEVGHRKGTKKCPYYYTEEAQRKREEQARKRKEKRDEEDRKQQEKMDALVAQHTQMAEQAEQIRIQIERFHQNNNHLPQMMEDVTKMFKKRKRK